MTIQQLTPQQAHTLMAQDKDIVYLDVRTVPEYEAGHPPSALNVPVVLPNPAVGKMVPNPDFLPTVAAHLPRDTKIIVGCQVGGRSQYAAEVLEHAGYQYLANMQGGFGGARDPLGQVVMPGWQDHGLPEVAGEGGAASYEALSQQRNTP